MDSFRSAAAIGLRPMVLLSGAVFAAIVAAGGCRANVPPRPTVGATTVGECRQSNDDAYYFPPEALIPRDAENDLTQRRVLNRYFTVANLPSLSCGPAINGYRLFWSGSGEAVAVTIIENKARAVKFGRTENGELRMMQQQEVSINAADLGRLSSIIDRSNYWTTQPFVDLEGEGVMWLFEVRRGSSYKAVTRVQPDQDFTEAARIMTRAIDFGLPPAMRIRN
jgi:hypothetical protein